MTRERIAYPDDATLLERIRSAAGELSLADVASGVAWYTEARSICRELAIDNGVTLDIAAGVVAAFSPRQFWSRNILVASEFLRTGKARGVLKRSLATAERVRVDGPTTALNGRKTRAFYDNLTGSYESVTIDVWMLRVVQWPVNSLSLSQYDNLERLFQQVAREVGLEPAHLQAALWVPARGRAG